MTPLGEKMTILQEQLSTHHSATPTALSLVYLRTRRQGNFSLLRTQLKLSVCFSLPEACLADGTTHQWAQLQPRP